MNSTQKNPGSQMWRRLNGYLTFEEWHQKPCFICGPGLGEFHAAKDQAHIDGWGILAPSPAEIVSKL